MCASSEPSKFKKIEPTLALSERQCAALLLSSHILKLLYLETVHRRCSGNLGANQHWPNTVMLEGAVRGRPGKEPARQVPAAAIAQGAGAAEHRRAGAGRLLQPRGRVVRGRLWARAASRSLSGLATDRFCLLSSILCAHRSGGNGYTNLAQSVAHCDLPLFQVAFSSWRALFQLLHSAATLDERCAV